MQNDFVKLIVELICKSYKFDYNGLMAKCSISYINAAVKSYVAAH